MNNPQCERALRDRIQDCPLFVRALMRTDPNQRLGHVQKRPGFVGTNWEEPVLLPFMTGLENH